MFHSESDRYQSNVSQAAATTARAAQLRNPAGDKEPAVILRDGRYVLGVLPIPDALRVAHEIADSIAAHKNTNR